MENKLYILLQEDIDIIEKQIKLQKKVILLFPLFAFCLVLAGTLRNYGRLPPFFINIIALIPMIFVGLYAPLTKGFLLGKIFYSIEIINDNQVQLTGFGTLWRKGKVIITHLKDIKLDAIPQPKLLYEKYSLNNIYIEGKKYYIFNLLLKELDLENNNKWINLIQ